MRTVLTLALFFVAANCAFGQLQGAPPTLKIVANVDKDKGHITFVDTVIKYVPVQKEIVEIVNGQQVKKVVTEYAAVQEQRMSVTDVGNSRVITPDGKQLPIDEVWKRVAKGTVIAMSGDGNQPAAAYLRALSAETLIVIPAPAKKIEPK
jgi:hypothetical protein